MKISKKELIKYLIIFAIIIVFIIPIKFIRSSLAEEEQYSLSAVLYDTEQYSAGGTGTALTNSGVTISSWAMNTSKYLKIDPEVPADGNTYKVKIILPQEMYIVSATDSLALQTGYSDVEFQKNAAISTNGGKSTYSLEKYSGTATYTMNYMGVSGTLQLELRYDASLWDEQKNSSITKEGVSPIVVQLIKDENGSESTLKELSVSKVIASTALPDSGYLTYTTSASSSSTTSAVELLVGKTVNANFSYTVNDQYSSKKLFYTELRIEIKLPEYTYENTKYYLPVNESTIALSSFVGGCNYTIDKTRLDTEGIYIIKVQNAYFTRSGTLVKFSFKDIPTQLSNLDNSKFPMNFTSGYLRIYGDGKNENNNILIRKKDLPDIKYIKEAASNVTIYNSNRNTSYWERPIDTVNAYGGAISSLGGGQITNKGTGDSGAKTFKYVFDTNNTGKMKITTMNIHADNVQQKIKIKYTLVDDNGERVYLDSSGNKVTSSTEGAIGEWEYELTNSSYNKTTLDNIYNRLYRSNLPSPQNQYYFKSVEYTLSKIRANAKLYSSGGAAGFGSAGNYYGYIATDITQDTIFYTKFTMTDVDTNTLEKTVTINTNAKNQKTTAYGVSNVKISKTSIIAGESCVVSGRISSSDYPYGYVGWLKNMRLGVLLPTGVSINDQAVSAKTSGGIVASEIGITSKTVSDGKVLWTLSFPEDLYIGYAKENLSALANGSYLEFSMQLNTSTTMNATTIFGREMLYATGVGQANAASGGWNWASTVDTYDLNENGSVTDKIGGVDSKNNPSCQIVSQTAMLDVNDSITVSSNGTTTESNEGTIYSNQDTMTYNLDINSESGGRVTEFSYYVPIPKTTSKVDNFLIHKKQFDSSLTEAVGVTGEDLFTIKYAFDKNITYNTAQNFNTWYSSEEIENSEELKYEDVTMVKLTNKTDFIQNGDKCKIAFKLKYSGNAFNEEAGMINDWASGGYYVHTSGDRETAGNYSTLGVSVIMKYKYENSDITLTAAKDGTPTTIGNVNKVTINKSLFPNFVNVQKYSIVSVENYNVTLQSKNYMQSNKDMAGTDANKTFAITVKLDDGNEVDITNNSEEILVGSGKANSAPQFTYKIYNADKLSDNSTSRYIVVTLVSDNGVTYKQKIIINREITQASDPESAIVAGKEYIAFDDTSASTTISGNSAFTSQIVTTYIPSVYKNHKISFSEILPKGTAITLANITESSSPKYYYYIADGVKSIIDFSDFTKMGTTSTKDYEYYTESDTIKEKLLLIVDFSKSETGYIEEGTYNLKMIMESDTIDDYVSKELTFIATSLREFSISSEDNTEFDTDFNVDYNITSVLGSESKYEGRKASIVITMPNTIPADSHILVNGNNYYLNSDKQFIIPLGDIQEITSSVTMKFLSDMLPTMGANYNCNIALWLSATANGAKPILGEKVAEKSMTLKAKKILTPSLKITGMNKRLIHKSELNQNVILNYNYAKDTNCKVTIELMQKVGSGYQKITDKLSSVNNVTTHNMGVFTLTPSNGNNSITLKLSSSTEVGTYRFMIRVSDTIGNEIINIPFNFLVVED